MTPIKTLDELEALYDTPLPATLAKVQTRLTPHYRTWIAASRFVVLTTVGSEGTDGSPRGDDGPVVQIADDTTLLLPDWRGNNRIDSLRNIVTDGRVSLMFMLPGCRNVIRVNGTAILTADAETVGRFERSGKCPKTVLVISLT
ncbi:MAG: MSMEG_1061 family FMN-dependent PPOX-type flavoprotein, partial [Pseudomonadota bacterium]